MEDVKAEALGLFSNSKPAWPKSFEEFLNVGGINFDSDLKSHASVWGEKWIGHLDGINVLCEVYAEKIYEVMTL